MALDGCMTFSWDDGHPSDLRVGEMLDQFGLNGTFYVPMLARTGTMNPGQIRQLSRRFEMGGHTLHHVSLSKLSDRLANQEICEGKAWMEEVTGTGCQMFCPPAGQFSRRHLRMIAQAGFTGMRTIELLSLSYPRRAGGIVILPTTVQAVDHSRSTILRHLLKRAAWRGLWTYVIRGGMTGEWESLARRMLETAAKKRSVFHLWGHSWELVDEGQWDRLRRILKLMGEMKAQLPCLTNGEICQRWSRDGESSGDFYPTPARRVYTGGTESR